MARNLKPGDKVTVDRPITFPPNSTSYQNGITDLNTNQVGTVIGTATQGRATLVDFDGHQATVATVLLVKIEKKSIVKRGPKPKKAKAESTLSTATVDDPATTEPVEPEIIPTSDPDLAQLVAMISNQLLLGGGLKNESETMLHLGFADLPAPVQEQVRHLIEAKLALTLTQERSTR